MSAKVDLYNGDYSNYEADAYRQIRIETYGHDLGQTSWVTAEESDEIPRALDLRSGSFVLEIGCGSGRYALRVAEIVGCRVWGVDINEPGIRNANQLVAAKSLASQVSFEHGDASKNLPFADEKFDAVFSNDVFCHIPRRLSLLRESFRVMKPGGRILFSDALVIGGTISDQEIATRSSIGYYIFSPPGENERLMQKAGFRVLEARDTTASAALIAKRRHDARDKRKNDLIAAEGKANFEGVQQFLATAHVLTSQRRLLRYLYLAQKPSGDSSAHPE
jgi:SAM-dependent methyltransferase